MNVQIVIRELLPKCIIVQVHLPGCCVSLCFSLGTYYRKRFSFCLFVFSLKKWGVLWERRDIGLPFPVFQNVVSFFPFSLSKYNWNFCLFICCCKGVLLSCMLDLNVFVSWSKMFGMNWLPLSLFMVLFPRLLIKIDSFTCLLNLFESHYLLGLCKYQNKGFKQGQETCFFTPYPYMVLQRNKN